MNKDVRVAVGYPRHKKTKRLLRLLGEKGVVAHITLLCYVGEFNPDGNLFGMSNEEIADAAGWTEDPDTFVSTLIDPVGYLDDVPGRGKRIHDWNDWNGYAAHAKQRSASAKKAARARWARSNRSCDPHSDPDSGSDAEGNAPSPSPFPSPPLRPSDSSEKTPPNPPGGSAEPKNGSTPPPGTLLSIPLNKIGTEHHVTQAEVDDLAADYPGLDVLAEIHKARAWCAAKPDRRKTARGVRAFLVNWLNRAQDRGGRASAAVPPGGYRPPPGYKEPTA